MGLYPKPLLQRMESAAQRYVEYVEAGRGAGPARSGAAIEPDGARAEP